MDCEAARPLPPSVLVNPALSWPPRSLYECNHTLSNCHDVENNLGTLFFCLSHYV